MIEVFKILNNIYDSSTTVKFIPAIVNITRGHSYRLYKSHVRYDLRKYSFSNRVINTWNSLPSYVVDSQSVNSFKNNLDKFWAGQEIIFNWKCEEMSGAGDRSTLSVCK